MYRIAALFFVAVIIGEMVQGWSDDDDTPPCATVCEDHNNQKAEECCREQGFASGYCRPWGVAHCLGHRSLRYRRHHRKFYKIHKHIE